MILQKEFNESGYKDILVGKIASEYGIDLKRCIIFQMTRLKLSM